MNATTQTVTSTDSTRTYSIEVSDRIAQGVPRGWFIARIGGVHTKGASGPDADAVMQKTVAAVLTGYYDEEIDYLAAA